MNNRSDQSVGGNKLSLDLGKDVFNHLLARWAKQENDKALRWSYDEVKKLTLHYNDFATEVYAEVQYQPAPFGFAPVRMRAIVRVPIDLDTMPHFPQDGFSLYEDGKLFGEEKRWLVKEAFAYDDEPSRIDLLLQN
jgi:hypothetical protein